MIKTELLVFRWRAGNTLGQFEAPSHRHTHPTVTIHQLASGYKREARGVKCRGMALSCEQRLSTSTYVEIGRHLMWMSQN